MLAKKKKTTIWPMGELLSPLQPNCLSEKNDNLKNLCHVLNVMFSARPGRASGPGESQGRGTQGCLGAPWLSPGPPWVDPIKPSICLPCFTIGKHG